jgi:hypothetical protein
MVYKGAKNQWDEILFLYKLVYTNDVDLKDKAVRAGGRGLSLKPPLPGEKSLYRRNMSIKIMSFGI